MTPSRAARFGRPDGLKSRPNWRTVSAANNVAKTMVTFYKIDEIVKRLMADRSAKGIKVESEPLTMPR